MPIVDYGDTPANLGAARRFTMSDDPADANVVTDPTALQTFGAAFRESNIVGSALASETSGLNRFTIEDGFDPIKEVAGTKYESRLDDAADIFNRPYFDAWKQQVDREEGDQRTLDAAGWGGLAASAVASIADLPTLVPGGALVRGAGAGVSILRTAASMAAAGAAGAALSEAGLQATQQTRTGLESAIGIGSGAVFGGLLGAGVGSLMNKVEQRAAVAAVEKMRQAVRAADEGGPSLTPELDEMETIFRGDADSSIGAAVADQDTLDDLSIQGRAAKLAGTTTGFLTPIGRAYQSPSVRFRDTMLNGLADNSVYMQKNMAGRGSQGAELFITMWENGALGTALREYRDVFKDARKAGMSMNRDDFSRAVGRAMRRADQGENEFVSQAAKVYRERVFEPLKAQAVELGLLPENVSTDTALSYFHRVYRRDKIMAQEPEFRAAIRGHVSAAIDQSIASDARKLNKTAENLQREIDEYETGILRRRSDFAQREAGREVELSDGATEADIISLVRQTRAVGRPKPPQSILGFLSSKGLYDPGNELAALGISNKSRPGLVRKTRATSWGKKQGGGLSLDDAARAAWEDGFFPGWNERPTIREFLDALDDDFKGTRRVVREADTEAAAAVDRLSQVERALTRMGVDLDNPKFGTSEEMKDLASKVNQASEDMDRQKIAGLREKLGKVSSERDQTADPFLSPEDRTEYVEGVLTDIIRTVTGQSGEDIPHGMVSNRQGPLKERTLRIQDDIIEPWLEDDVEMVARRYVRKMAADVELTRRFGRADMRDQVIEIQADYDDLKAAAGSEAARTALAKREASDISDLYAVRDMLRGQFDPKGNATSTARILNAAMTFNFMRSMGGVTLASLTDAVRPAMVNGLSAYVKDALVPLMTNLEGIKLSAKDAKLAGAISEIVMQSRIAQWAELTDPYAANSKFERLLGNLSQRFGVMTGLAHWTDFQNTISSVMTQSRILRNVQTAWHDLTSKERNWMSFVGVDESQWRRVSEQFKRWGTDHKGLPIANTESWNDDIAKRVFYAAVLKDVRSTIVAKGVGDVPVFAHTPWGRALFQFKTFSIASNQKVLMRGLQEDKANLVGGLVGLMAMGAFTYWLKNLEAGREVSNNPGTWVAEGLDRSGLFAVGFEINNAFEKTGGPGVYSLLSMLGQKAAPGSDAKQPASRFATRGVVEGFLGPTFGLANDVVSTAAIPLRGTNRTLDMLIGQGNGEAFDVTPSDITTFRRLAPFASLPYWRWLIDNMAVPAAKEAVR